MSHARRSLLSLLVLCAAVFVLTGCSQEGTPYTEKTAEIDPAMNMPETPEPPEPTSDTSDTTKPQAAAEPSPYDLGLTDASKVELTDEQWMQVLSKEEYYILRRSGTERPNTGRYNEHPKDKKGAFHCVGCGNKLYDAKHKFHSGCGWPSFFQETEPAAITTHVDHSAGMIRTEMRCARCDGHLGHIFNDGFGTPTGLRHCVNGNILIFVPEGENVKEVIKAHRAKYASK